MPLHVQKTTVEREFEGRDPTLPPQILDLFSQGNLGPESRSQFGNALFMQLMNSLRGGGGFGGGRGRGGRGGGRRGGRGRGRGGGGGRGGDFDLADFQIGDKEIQSRLGRATTGIEAGTSDAIRALRERAAQTGNLGGGALGDQELQARIAGASGSAAAKRGVESEIFDTNAARSELRAKLQAALKQSRISASAQVRSARLSARPGILQARLSERLAPLQFLQAFKPFAVNFPQKRFLETKTTEKSSSGIFGSLLKMGLGIGGSLLTGGASGALGGILGGGGARPGQNLGSGQVGDR